MAYFRAVIFIAHHAEFQFILVTIWTKRLVAPPTTFIPVACAAAFVASATFQHVAAPLTLLLRTICTCWRHGACAAVVLVAYGAIYIFGLASLYVACAACDCIRSALWSRWEVAFQPFVMFKKLPKYIAVVIEPSNEYR